MKLSHAAEVANWIGSTIEGSSCSDLLTRIVNGHIRMGSAGKGRINLRGVGSSLSQQAESPGASISVIRCGFQPPSSLASVVIIAKSESTARSSDSSSFPKVRRC